MSKIHINSNGEPGVCKATTGACPFGDADTHFSSNEEAAAAYGNAQEAMGNASFGQDSRSIEDRYVSTETKEEALKVANLIANEGKYAAVVTYSKQFIKNLPEEDNFEDEDDYTEALYEIKESAREGDAELEEPYSQSYQVRAFDTFEEATDVDEDVWNVDRDSTDIPVDVSDPDAVAFAAEVDDYNPIMISVSVEFKKPKS